MRLCYSSAGLFLIAGFAVALAADVRDASDKVITADKVITGDLVSIDDKAITLKTGDGPVSLGIQKEVLELSLQTVPPLKEMPFCHQVELMDGSLVRIKPQGGLVIKENKATLTLLNDQKVELPLTALSYVLKNANDAKVRENADWKRCLKERAIKDMVARWDPTRTRINGLEGTFADKGNGSVLAFTLASSGTVRDLDLFDKENRTQGWIFANKPNANAPVAICRLLDSQFNELAVARVTAQAGTFEVVTVAGVKLTYPQAQVAKLDFRKGRLEYLSDMEPKIVKQPTDDRERYQFYGDAEKRNKNMDHAPLQMAGQKYAKGMSLPVPTTLQYELNGEYKDFSAVIGVDETVRGGSRAELIIEGDGRKLFSAEVKRNDPPQSIRLNIKDINQLTIKVERAGLPYGHRIDLADVKVNK